jgi:hypothetical protein
MTTNEALSEWSAINGGSGAGLTDAQFLHDWAGPAGLLGTRIRGWHLLSTSNLTAVKKAIKASGAIYAGIVLPSTGNGASTIDPVLTDASNVAGHGLTLFGWTSTRPLPMQSASSSLRRTQPQRRRQRRRRRCDPP